MHRQPLPCFDLRPGDPVEIRVMVNMPGVALDDEDDDWVRVRRFSDLIGFVDTDKGMMCRCVGETELVPLNFVRRRA